MDAQNKLNEAQIQALKQQKKLQKTVNLGASWFYAIAIISILNSMLVIFRTDEYLYYGLGITMLFEYLGQNMGFFARVFTFAVSIFVSCFFIVFGYFSRKGYSWFYLFGMILYAIDGLLFILVKDWQSIGFHAVILFFLYIGLEASYKMEKMINKD